MQCRICSNETPYGDLCEICSLYESYRFEDIAYSKYYIHKWLTRPLRVGSQHKKPNDYRLIKAVSKLFGYRRREKFFRRRWLAIKRKGD